MAHAVLPLAGAMKDMKTFEVKFLFVSPYGMTTINETFKADRPSVLELHISSYVYVNEHCYGLTFVSAQVEEVKETLDIRELVLAN
jgi:hypothetical protein